MPAYKYLVDEAEFPYCSGCGHTWINKSLAKALEKLNKDPRQINLVSDIGCVGLVDKLFLTNTIHTLHGRSTAVATGLQLADSVLYSSDTKHIVMIGDGGSTIGLLHLVEAARLNADITVLLHNNFVYGMTGGQNSGFTPIGFRTASTMDGNLVAPIHIAEMLRATGATFIARKLATDTDLDDTILAAINHPGFALVEVIELCTGYASKWNKLTKTDVQTILENSNSAELGILHQDLNRESYASSYRKYFPTQNIIMSAAKDPKAIAHGDRHADNAARDDGMSLTGATDAERIPPLTRHCEAGTAEAIPLPNLEILLCGSAGEGVQFAARSMMQVAMANGMNALQKNDNPITIGTGFSMSELKLSKQQILYSGIDEANYILISSADGFNRIKSEINTVTSSNCTIICDSSLEEALAKITKLNIHSDNFRSMCKNKRDINFILIGRMLKLMKTSIEPEDFRAVLSKNTEAIIVAIQQGFEI